LADLPSRLKRTVLRDWVFDLPEGVGDLLDEIVGRGIAQIVHAEPEPLDCLRGGIGRLVDVAKIFLQVENALGEGINRAPGLFERRFDAGEKLDRDAGLVVQVLQAVGEV